MSQADAVLNSTYPVPTTRPEKAMRRQRDIGETLTEILLTVVITGLTVTSLISSLATAGNAGNTQRSSVATDVVMRNYAEATKAAAQLCVAAASYTVSYTPPPGYTTSVTPIGGVCPSIASTQLLQLSVAGPRGSHETMQIKVRTP